MAKGLPRSLKHLYELVARGAPTAGVGSEEKGLSIKRTVLNFKDTVLELADNPGTIAFGSKKIYGFPEANVLLLGSRVELTATRSAAGVDADAEGDFGLGTAAASNNSSLSSTEQDIVPSTAITFDEGVAPVKGASTATEAPNILDGTGTAKDVYLNVIIDDGDHDVTETPTNLLINGKVELFWVNLGDI